MKLREYRNPGIQTRLDRAAKTWCLDDPKRSFQEPEPISVSRIITWLLYGALLSIVLLVLWIGEEDGPLFLAVILPIIAIRTFLQTARIHATPNSSEVTHLLPLSDQTLTRQIRTDFRRPITLGLILASILGAFGAGHEISPGGAMQGLLIFVGLLGGLTLSYYWRFFAIFTLLAYGCIVLLFAGMVIDQVKGFNRAIIEASPWFQGFHSPLVLGVFTLTGAGIAWLTRNRWSKIARFDRTVLYQNRERGVADAEVDVEVKIEGSPETLDERPSLPTHPAGLIEGLVWSLLTTKEKGLLRAQGPHPTTFLSAWFKTTLVFLFALWLTHFDWPPPFDSFRPIAALFALGAMVVHTRLCSSPPTRYLHGIVIGPQTSAPRFHALPLGLPALEKLMWKDGFIRWFLMALTLALASHVHHSPDASLQQFPIKFFVAFILILHLHWLYFWNASINGWIPRNGRGRVWTTFIQIVLFLGLLFTFISSAFLYAIFLEREARGILSGTGPYVLAIAVYQVILRILVRSFIADTRSDLVRHG